MNPSDTIVEPPVSKTEDTPPTKPVEAAKSERTEPVVTALPSLKEVEAHIKGLEATRDAKIKIVDDWTAKERKTASDKFKADLAEAKDEISELTRDKKKTIRDDHGKAVAHWNRVHKALKAEVADPAPTVKPDEDDD